MLIMKCVHYGIYIILYVLVHFTAMAKDTEASSTLPKWPQKMVLLNPKAKLMNWAIIWGRQGQITRQSSKYGSLSVLSLSLYLTVRYNNCLFYLNVVLYA